MKKWYIIPSLLVVMLLTTSCSAINRAPSPAGELAIFSHGMTGGESGGAEVSETVKNVGSSTIDLAGVTVEFYDAAKILIETSSDGVMNLEPGETWDFKIACSGADCVKVKTYEITATATTGSRGY